MKYKNACDILPDELLREVLKYVGGEILYFPKHGRRKNWGESTGAKKYYKERNAEIKEKYMQRATVEELAEEYNLSTDTIRKIVYR